MSASVTLFTTNFPVSEHDRRDTDTKSACRKYASTFMRPDKMLAVVLTRDLEAIGCNRLVIRSSHHCEPNVLVPANNKGVEGADPALGFSINVR